LLPDSGHIQEEDAAFANRHGFSKHAPALPLYTRQDALDCLPQIKAMHKAFQPIPGWRATLERRGHILGACSVMLEVAGRRILFSGDLGRPDDTIMFPPDPAPAADTVLIESTYGDRQHPSENLMAELGPALHKLPRAVAWRLYRCLPWAAPRPYAARHCPTQGQRTGAPRIAHFSGQPDGSPHDAPV
jgi:metallo-beta-lactamase family protein